MRPAKRQSLYILLAALVRHHSPAEAAKLAAREHRLDPPSPARDHHRSRTDRPGHQLSTLLEAHALPVERALLEMADTPAQLSARLTDAAAIANTEHLAGRAFFRAILLPILLGATFFFFVVIFFWPALIATALPEIMPQNDSMHLYLAFYQVLFLVFFIAIPIFLFALRRWTRSWLSLLPGTEHLIRSARGAWASQMMSLQLRAGASSEQAAAMTSKTMKHAIHRLNEPLLLQLLSADETDPAPFHQAHILLRRRLVNTKAQRLAWLPPAMFWLFVAVMFASVLPLIALITELQN